MDDKLEYWIVDMLENIGAAMYEKKLYRSAEAMVEMQLLAINEINASSGKDIGEISKESLKGKYLLPRLVS